MDGKSSYDRRSVLKTAGTTVVGLTAVGVGTVSADVDLENCTCEEEFECLSTTCPDRSIAQRVTRECCECGGDIVCSDWELDGCCGPI